MSRFRTLVLAAGLAAAPISALAAPPATAAPQTEHFEWSMTTGHGRLGLAILGLTPELRTYFGAAKDRGVLVGHVEPDSPAAKAGVQVGDVITEIAGRRVEGVRDVLAGLAAIKKGEVASIDAIRDHEAVVLRPILTDDPLPVAPFEGAAGWPDQRWFQRFDHAWPSPARRPSGKTGSTS